MKKHFSYEIRHRTDNIGFDMVGWLRYGEDIPKEGDIELAYAERILEIKDKNEKFDDFRKRTQQILEKKLNEYMKNKDMIQCFHG